MDITVSDDELAIICRALQLMEERAEDDVADIDEQQLTEARRLFQRLHTLRTAK